MDSKRESDSHYSSAVHVGLVKPKKRLALEAVEADLSDESGRYEFSAPRKKLKRVQSVLTDTSAEPNEDADLAGQTLDSGLVQHRLIELREGRTQMVKDSAVDAPVAPSSPRNVDVGLASLLCDDSAGVSLRNAGPGDASRRLCESMKTRDGSMPRRRHEIDDGVAPDRDVRRVCKDVDDWHELKAATYGADRIQQDPNLAAGQHLYEEDMGVRAKQQIARDVPDLETNDRNKDITGKDDADDRSHKIVSHGPVQIVHVELFAEAVGTFTREAARNHESSDTTHADLSVTSPRPSVFPSVGCGSSSTLLNAEAGSSQSAVAAASTADNSFPARPAGVANAQSLRQTSSEVKKRAVSSTQPDKNGKADATPKAAKVRKGPNAVPRAARTTTSTAGRNQDPLTGLTPETFDFIQHVKGLTDRLSRETRRREEAESRVKRRDRKIRRLESSQKGLAKSLEEEQARRQRVEENLIQESEALGECQTALDKMRDEVQTAKEWLEKVRDVAGEGLDVVR